MAKDIVIMKAVYVTPEVNDALNQRASIEGMKPGDLIRRYIDVGLSKPSAFFPRKTTFWQKLGTLLKNRG